MRINYHQNNIEEKQYLIRLKNLQNLEVMVSLTNGKIKCEYLPNKFYTDEQIQYELNEIFKMKNKMEK